MKELPPQQIENAANRLKRDYADISLPKETKQRIRARFWASVETRPPMPRTANRIWIFGIIALGVVVVLVWTVALVGRNHRRAAKESDSFQAIVVSLSGDAVMKSGDSEYPVVPRMPVPAGAQFTTKSRDTLVVGIGPHRMNVGPSSAVSIERLERDMLTFSLEQGRIELDVSPLSPGSHLEVTSGDVAVYVVGTRFAVDRKGACTTVEVSKGSVRVETPKTRRFLSKGERDTMCTPPELSAAKTAPAKGTELREAPAAVADLTAEAKHPTPSQFPSPRFRIRRRDTRDTDVAPSPEESLFIDAKTKLQQEELNDAYRRFKAYLDQYPDGLFGEDARFHFTRTAYRLRRYGEVCESAHLFIEKFDNASDRRDAQVRALCAHVLVEQDHNLNAALELLSPLTCDVMTLSEPLKRHIISILMKATCAPQSKGECETWARAYLDAYPNGNLADEARQHLSENE